MWDLGHDDECGSNDDDEEEKEDDQSNSNDDESESKSRSDSSESSTPKNDAELTLPAPTLSEGIEISGLINNVVDGDTLDVNNIRIRLALVNTAEVGEEGFDSAKNFVEDLCLEKKGEVNIDDGQRQGSFGREIGVMYCDGINLNEALMLNKLAVIETELCEVSEFANEDWAEC